MQRDDCIFTPSAGFDVTINKHFSAAAAYSYDWVESYIPNTDGREFTRHLGSISVRYAF